jgi:hypothetical protein
MTPGRIWGGRGGALFAAGERFRADDRFGAGLAAFFLAVFLAAFFPDFLVAMKSSVLDRIPASRRPRSERTSTSVTVAGDAALSNAS